MPEPEDTPTSARVDTAMAKRKDAGDPAAPPAAATETLSDLQSIEAAARADQAERAAPDPADRS